MLSKFKLLFLSITGLEYENNYIDEKNLNFVNNYEECNEKVDVIYMNRIFGY